MKKYLTKFNNYSEYIAFKQSDEFIKPNVSKCIEEDKVQYNRTVTFMFINGSMMRMIPIPFTEGITSDAFNHYIPKNSLYCGFISTPISVSDTTGKTKAEIDSMFDDYTRAKIAKSAVDLEINNVYKVIIFEKSKYINNSFYNKVGSSIYLLFCIPNNLFRSAGVVIDGNETQIKGSLARNYTIDVNGVSKTYTPYDLFGIDDAYFCVTNISGSVTVGETYAFKAFYTTYDNVTIISDNIILEGTIV